MVSPMPRASTEDVVLLHGYTGTCRTWERVSPHLPRDLHLHPLALRGHAYGKPLADGVEPTVEALADGVAADMDERGLDRAHLVGSSLGGWLALELAARGRALSVTGFGTAGMWRGADDPTQRMRRRMFDRLRATGRVAVPLLRVTGGIGLVRRLGMRDMAVRGDRLSKAQMLESVRGMLACTLHPALMEATEDGARRYEDLPCPVTLLVCEHDRLFPPADYVEQTRERVPQADVRVLPGTGHLPMVDDPVAVAREIERSVRAAARAAA